MESVLLGDCKGELLLVFVAVYVVTYLLYRHHNSTEGVHKLPPSLPALPVIGSLPFLPTKKKDIAEYCVSPRNKLGKIFSFYAGSRYAV